MTSSAKTILFIANELGNFLHHRKNLVALAERHGFSPIIVANPTGEDVAPCTYRPLTFDRFGLHLFQDFRLFFKTLSYCLKDKPDLVHLINLKPYLYGGLACRLARLLGWKGRTIMTVPGLGRLFDHQGRLRDRLQKRLVEFFLKFAVHRNAVTFETAQSRDVWVARGLVPYAQTNVINGTGIDLGTYKTTQPRPRKTTTTCLFAGRLLRAKGLDIFMAASEQFRDQPDITFLVAGFPERDDPDAIHPDVLSKANLTFLGVVTDMPTLLGETDIVVLPSLYNEGIPRILIEAAAIGCVPLATQFPGSEAIIQNGETGFFIEGSSLEKKTAHLVQLIAALHRDTAKISAIGRQASAFIRNNAFSSDAIEQAFLNLYLDDSQQARDARKTQP